MSDRTFACIGLDFSNDDGELRVFMRECDLAKVEMIGRELCFKKSKNFKHVNVGGVYKFSDVKEDGENFTVIGSPQLVRPWPDNDAVAEWQTKAATIKLLKQAYSKNKSLENKAMLDALEPIARGYRRLPTMAQNAFKLKLINYLDTGRW